MKELAEGQWLYRGWQCFCLAGAGPVERSNEKKAKNWLKERMAVNLEYLSKNLCSVMWAIK